MRDASSPIPSTRSTRSRARSSGLNPDELGSPWGAAISSFLAFAAGALLPLRRSCSLPGRTRCRSRSASPALALFGVGAMLSLFTGRNAVFSGAADAGAGRPRRRRHLRDRQTRRRDPWLSGPPAGAAPQAGTREVAAAAASVGVLGRGRARRRRSAQAGDTVAVRRAPTAMLARAAYRRQSQIRARVWSFDARQTRSTRRSSRAACGTRRRAARRLSPTPRTPAAASFTAKSDGLPGVVADRYGDVVVVPVLVGRRRALARARSSTRCRGVPARLRLRALGRRRARARRPGAARVGSAARRACRSDGRDRRGRPALPRRRRARAEDRLLPRPARQPRPRAPRSPRGREVLNVLLLHRRLHAGRAGRRRARACCRSTARRPALALARAQRSRCNAARAARGASGSRRTCSRELRQLRDSGRELRSHRARSAQVRADRRARRAARRARYKDINLLALKLLRPAGCWPPSPARAASTPELFRKIVAGAALDAGADAAVVGHFAAAPTTRRARLPRGRVPQGPAAPQSALRRCSSAVASPSSGKNKAATGCPVRPCQPRPGGQEVTRP